MANIFPHSLQMKRAFLWFEETEVEFQDKLIVEKDWKWFLNETKKLAENRASRPLNLQIPDCLQFKNNILVIRNPQLDTYDDLFYLWHFVLYPRVVRDGTSTIFVSPQNFNINIPIQQLPHNIVPILYKILKDSIEWCRNEFFRIIAKGIPFHPLPMTEKEALLYQSMIKMGLAPMPQYRISNKYNNFKYDYALDFAFENEKFYVECDDDSHMLPERIQKDLERERILKEFGWNAIRFSNKEIGVNPNKCALKVKEIVGNHKIKETSNLSKYSEPASIIDKSLDANQRSAAMHLSGPAVVIAGPGAGKTKTMVERVAFLIKNGVDPEGIVVITFTKKASNELIERLQVKCGKVVEKINISTIHSFFFSKIFCHYHRIHGLAIPKILEDKKRVIKPAYKGLIKKYRAALNIDEVIQFIDRLKESFVTSLDFKENLDNSEFMQKYIRHWDRSFTKNELQFIAELYDQYERIKRKNKQIDFGDMIGYTYKILLGEAKFRTEIQRKFTHILIDEFQDTGRYIYLILQTIAAPEDNLYVIGDDDQSIYGFRGAEPEVLLNFDKDYPNYSLYVLDINYRSLPPIVNYANR